LIVDADAELTHGADFELTLPTGWLRISAHRGRHFRLIADAVSG